MIKDRVVNPSMTVCVRANSGKRNSIKCDRRQKCDKNNGNSGKKDIDTERPALPREPRKRVERQETIEESNIEEGATIEMSLRIMYGMKNKS